MREWTPPPPPRPMSTSGRVFLALLGLVGLVLVIGVITSEGTEKRDRATLAAIDRAYGSPPGCLANANDGNWQEAAVVLDSQSTDDFIIVEVYLTQTVTGVDRTYRFAVQTGSDGMPSGGVVPGNALAAQC